MALRFGPEQEDEFEAACDDLVRRFEEATGSDRGWAARDVLGYKWRYLDGDLVAWSVDDVEALLFEIFPAKVTLGPNDPGELIAGFAAFLRFLSEERLLSEGTGERLAKRVEAALAEFVEAMSDEDRFSFGKRLVTEMVADGVDPTDQEAMNQWITSFNERSFEERDRVVGPALERNRRAAAEGDERTRLPPVVLAPEDEVRAAAGETVVVQQVRDLVGFVGNGRKLTDKGNLILADGKALQTLLGTDKRPGWVRDEDEGGPRVRSSKHLRELDLLFRLALAAEFLEMPGARTVRTGPAAGLLDSDPLEAARRLLEAALTEVGLVQHDRGDDHYGFGWYAEDLDEALTRLLLDLYVETEPLPIEGFVEEVWADLNDLYDLADVEEYKLDMHLELMELSARRALRQLAALGVVEESGIETRTKEWGSTEEYGGTVALTPLGQWLVHGILAAVADVPVAGSLAEVTADELLSQVGDLPDDIAWVELEVWLQAHGDAAMDLLVDALGRADETGRTFAFEALFRLGPPTEDQVTQLESDAELSPYVLIWRVHTLAAEPEELDVGDDAERLVQLLNGVLSLWGPEVMTAWLGPAAGRTGRARGRRLHVAGAPPRHRERAGHARRIPWGQARGQGRPEVVVQVPLQRGRAELSSRASAPVTRGRSPVASRSSRAPRAGPGRRCARPAPLRCAGNGPAGRWRGGPANPSPSAVRSRPTGRPGRPAIGHSPRPRARGGRGGRGLTASPTPR